MYKNVWSNKLTKWWKEVSKQALGSDENCGLVTKKSIKDDLKAFEHLPPACPSKTENTCVWSIQEVLRWILGAMRYSSSM